MFTDDTIAAISTPVGHSGIGIVRLSGSNAINITDTLFVSHNKKCLRRTPSHRIVYGHIVNSDKEIIDEVLVSVMRAPHTYTKEDIVEINCHGGPVPLRRILEHVLQAGARVAGPGEFTQRAFLNGRIDLAQAEAVLDVIHALTEESQRIAVEQLKGGLSRRLGTIRNELMKLTAFVEAHIDFPEDDISPPSLKEMKKMSIKIERSLEELIQNSRYGMILREGLKTAIVGRPNVGKSSLLNALLEHDRAIVTEVPGTTRDVIEEYLNVHGIPIRIMDTAGIRAVTNKAEKEGVKRSIRAMKNADLVLVVLDGSKHLNTSDRELMRKAGFDGNTSCRSQNAILVVNKTDLPQKIKLIPLKKKGRKDLQRNVVRISALKQTGLDTLKTVMAEMAFKGTAVSGQGTGIVTNIRHVRALEKTLAALHSFSNEVSKNTSPELLAVELRDALDALGEILGTTTPDDILNTIFSNFCIGK
jgi:tRNA modification GTPase